MWKVVVQHEQERYLKQNAPNPETDTSNLRKESQPSVLNESEVSINQSLPLKQGRSKSLKSFVPFVMERDGLNRLIKDSNAKPKRNSPKAKALDFNKICREFSEKKGFSDRTSLMMPEENKLHLVNLLDLDPDPESPTQRKPLESSKQQVIMEEDENNDLSQGFSLFRAHQKSYDKIILSSKRASIMRNRSGGLTERDSLDNSRPSAPFLAISREKVEKIRARSTTRSLEARHTDASVVDLLKRRAPKIMISKVENERSKTVIKSDDKSFYDPKNDGHVKWIPNFSSQISREVRDRILSNEERVIKEVPKPKDIKEMDKEFQFASNIRKKYIFTEIRIPRSWDLKPKNCPYNPSKLNEITNNIFRTYSLKRTKSGRKSQANRL